MKSIKQILEEKTMKIGSEEDRKLSVLVRSGLFDPHKLMIIRRALGKENAKMTKIERENLLDLLDKLLELVTTNRQLYTKVRQTVSEESLLNEEDFVDISLEEASKVDFDINQIPSLIVMKRRAIRVFPDGQKVALYWADRINKYISVPFQSIGISESSQSSIQTLANANSNDDDLDQLQKYYMNHMKSGTRAGRQNAEQALQKIKKIHGQDAVEATKQKHNEYLDRQDKKRETLGYIRNAGPAGGAGIVAGLAIRGLGKLAGKGIGAAWNKLRGSRP